MKNQFQLVAPYQPAGDQPKAIQQICDGILKKFPFQTLLGVTGSGKTFTIAQVIQNIQKPTLVVSHNKTLCAQLYREFKEFFPHNAVEYFVSYYDYYQPEAYIPASDTYIEKDASINDEIDRLRLSATASLLARKDVIVVASVSFIYGLGSPQDYQNYTILLKKNHSYPRKQLLKNLVDIQYERLDLDFTRSSFRVRGDVVDIRPAYSKEIIRVDFFDDQIESISSLDPISLQTIESLDSIIIYPAKHFVCSKKDMKRAISDIQIELQQQVQLLKNQGKEFEAHRLHSKTMYDLEMIQHMGYCSGIENYSRHFSGKKPGEPPWTLLDYFSGKNFLLFVDESHVTLSQIRAMYAGDQARKQVLVNFGFRLPSALDNRPLQYHEFESLSPQTIFVSATPGQYESKTSHQIVEQIIRPTGLLDPSIEIRPTRGQIDDILSEIQNRSNQNQRSLVLTLTKKESENLAQYLLNHGIQARYLHSEIDTIQRVEILRDLRLGLFHCLVGINLLREGLDLPEVSLVIILSADKIGFLRSSSSLIQISGRAARHSQGHVIMYADSISESMQYTISETSRRRNVQKLYNQNHNIQPRSIQKSVKDILERKVKTKLNKPKLSIDVNFIKSQYNLKSHKDQILFIKHLNQKMLESAQNLEFETAAFLRNTISKFKNQYSL